MTPGDHYYVPRLFWISYKLLQFETRTTRKRRGWNRFKIVDFWPT